MAGPKSALSAHRDLVPSGKLSPAVSFTSSLLIVMVGMSVRLISPALSIWHWDRSATLYPVCAIWNVTNA